MTLTFPLHLVAGTRRLNAVALLTMALFSAACSQPQDITGIDDPARLDDFHLDLNHLATEEWVDVYEPTESYDGVNLVLYRRRVPILMDMNGSILHSWPSVRAVGRARFNSDGSLSVIGRDNLIKEYDWDGKLLWYYRIDARKGSADEAAGDFPHHDFARIAGRHYLVIVRSAADGMDHIHEVDRSGQVVWEWHSGDHLDRHYPDWRSSSHAANDPVHMNSVREIPSNRWFDEGDERFRPGNILVSARNLNSLLVIDRSSGEIVWTHSQDLDFQHEAIMIDRGQPGAGLITVFNNGYRNLNAYRQSSVLAINPTTHEVEWQYRQPGFYSSVAGTQQSLPNGNVMITSSESGRVFEVNRNREVVWEWVPPFLPMRAERYPWDFCSRFAELRRQPPKAVPPNRDWAFIDLELYALTIPEEQDHRRIDGRMLTLLPENNACDELWIPPQSTIQMQFGLDSSLLGERSISARFQATITSLSSNEDRVLVNEVVGSGDETHWRRIKTPLSGFDLHRVELCVSAYIETEIPEAEASDIVVWVKPRIRSRAVRTYSVSRPDLQQTAEEEALEKQQLQALGYVQ